MSENVGTSIPFAVLMGVEVTERSKDRIKAEMLVREDLCTSPTMLHGGALMALADTLGAIGAFLNIPEGANGTTTIESKTNFLRAAQVNTIVYAEAIPIHVGRRMSVWQTTVTNEEGKTIGVVTQTQMVL